MDSKYTACVSVDAYPIAVKKTPEESRCTLTNHPAATANQEIFVASPVDCCVAWGIPAISGVEPSCCGSLSNGFKVLQKFVIWDLLSHLF